LGLLFDGGKHESPDARRGAMWCAVPVEEIFVVDEVFWSFVVLWLCRNIVLKVLAWKLSGIQISARCALECVPYDVSTNTLTGVSIA
jgi:hypothetical protein